MYKVTMNMKSGKSYRVLLPYSNIEEFIKERAPKTFYEYAWSSLPLLLEGQNKETNIIILFSEIESIQFQGEE